MRNLIDLVLTAVMFIMFVILISFAEAHTSGKIPDATEIKLLTEGGYYCG